MKLGSNARRILICCGAIDLAMLLYPPFLLMGRGIGYSWIFAPQSSYAVINAGQLLVQWAAVAIVGGIAFLLVESDSLGASTSAQANRPADRAKALTIALSISGLRVLRALFMLACGWIVVGVVSSLVILIHHAIGTTDEFGGVPVENAWEGIGQFVAMMMIKVVTAIVCFGLAGVLRWMINRMHAHWRGQPHPSLAKRWSL